MIVNHTDNIRDYIRPGLRAHLVGIGGVSMAPLAEVLHGAGVIVSGSDWHESDKVDHLRSLGIQVFVGPQKAENIAGTGCVIRTAAAHDDTPEIAAARAAGIPVFERAQAWGSIMQDYKNALCISGTHGKTTTTSMCTQIIMAAGMDPTVMIGGTLPLLGSGHRVGRGDTIILESCEYCNSFLSFFPTIAVILNIEADHLDFFKDLADVEHSFRAFADRIPDGGLIIANCEDENTMLTLAGEIRPILTFGVEKGDVHAENLTFDHGCGEFDAVHDGKVYAHIKLAVPGIHNVKNALAAAASAMSLHVPGSAVEQGLRDFRLPGRRFEHKGEYNGAQVYDDYAHHPGELHGLQAGHLRLPAPHLFPHPRAVRRLREGAPPPGRHRAGRDLRRPGDQYPRHLLQRSGGADPRQRLLPHAGRRHRRPPPSGPARGPDPHRGRGRHLHRRRKAAGKVKKVKKSPTDQIGQSGIFIYRRFSKQVRFSQMRFWKWNMVLPTVR